ncbi:hypothetical protein [Pseudonocardia sp.]|jgi:hypothetical protein|uniref:hypothetical protein n=1 Tax=Pseudonocardia sp. TaxID=60912 RepID=UPI00260E8F4C|nr:hypothetical protein [Pseudonocardia sp.]
MPDVLDRLVGDAEQAAAGHLVDHAAEEEPELVLGGLVGVGGQLEGHGEAEDVVITVESLSRPILQHSCFVR